MKKIISKIFTTRVRMDLRDNCPMIANYFLGIFIEAKKYNPNTGLFDVDVSESQYLEQLY